ncbi:maltotransferase domain-containing protein, partial [Streptomyces sp. NPDC008313]|uniref:maltotransferase domain-containing protein n=1 Tax=Streptomyces sp. NPDC008313 TaxID=3364826 RepID=UPI0036E0F9A4
MPAAHHSSAPPASGPPGPARSHPSPSGQTPPAPAQPAGTQPAGTTPGPASSRSRPRTPPPRPRPGPAPAPAAPPALVGRIPVLDVSPLVLGGRAPAKAVVGEEFEVSATVFREGHEAVAANVVLRDPSGRPGPWTPMRELAPGTDRWGAHVTPDAVGRWT